MDLNQERLEHSLYIGRLLFRISAGEDLSGVERAELDEWIGGDPERAGLFRNVTDRQMLMAELAKQNTKYDAGEAAEAVLGVLGLNRNRKVRVLYGMTAAAVVIVAVVSVWFFFYSKKSSYPVALKPLDSGRITVQRRNGVTLTLGDGRRIALDSAKNGKLAQLGGTSVSNRNGGLIYSKVTADTRMEYNILTTPPGGQYRLMLPDGTRVWLNASSSVHYPVTFGDSIRAVSLSGEAYFEVEKDKARPFVLTVEGGLPVTVLGTAFNVNAYADEVDVRTTLLEGSVKTGGTLLRPGQQARTRPGIRPVVNTCDTSVVMAWRKGLFRFEDAGVGEVMRQISRWYGVSVGYESDVPDLRVDGQMQMSLGLADVLTGLGRMGLHYRTEGKRIVVLP
ncbi:MAG TPA: FecR domain-containing protein [Puia sp.]